jgi:hypothetical protein
MALVDYPFGGGITHKMAVKMGNKRAFRDLRKSRRIGTKAGAPTDDVDLAAANGDLLWDSTNSDIYRASNVAASTTTWTKIVD